MDVLVEEDGVGVTAAEAPVWVKVGVLVDGERFGDFIDFDVWRGGEVVGGEGAVILFGE